MKAKQSQHDRSVDADVRCRQWLAKATDARVSGKVALAEKCEAKAQFWMDRWNRLLGNY